MNYQELEEELITDAQCVRHHEESDALFGIVRGCVAGRLQTERGLGEAEAERGAAILLSLRSKERELLQEARWLARCPSGVLQQALAVPSAVPRNTEENQG